MSRNHFDSIRCSIPAVLLGTLGFLVLAASGCGTVEAEPLCDGDAAELVRPENWTKESHCNGVSPDYARVFDTATLHRFEITISATEAAIVAARLEEIENSTETNLDNLPTPPYVHATVSYGGLTWTEVGMRYKGHASLQGALKNNMKKLAFVLEFDHWEDEQDSLMQQRFFGFKQLSFSNGYNDPSLIRDKTAAEIFRAAGIPAARSAFAPVYFDDGDGTGLRYMGLYTMIEDPSDKMLETQLGDGSGNLYKPWSEAARLIPITELAGGDAEFEETFEKANNTLTPDFSDARALLTALHTDRTEPVSWRSNLEAVFNVDRYLLALAVNQIMVNWDSYGCMPHNYLLYKNPLDSGRFLYMPWDLNESLMKKELGSCAPSGSVLLDEIVSPAADSTINTNWPLIKYLLADPTYRALYIAHLGQVLDGAFAEATVTAQMQADTALISPFVIGPEAVETYPYLVSTGFETALAGGRDGSGLLSHVATRQAEVRAVLTSLTAAQ